MEKYFFSRDTRKGFTRMLSALYYELDAYMEGTALGSILDKDEQTLATERYESALRGQYPLVAILAFFDKI